MPPKKLTIEADFATPKRRPQSARPRSAPGGGTILHNASVRSYALLEMGRSSPTGTPKAVRDKLMGARGASPFEAFSRGTVGRYANAARSPKRPVSAHVRRRREREADDDVFKNHFFFRTQFSARSCEPGAAQASRIPTSPKRRQARPTTAGPQRGHEDPKAAASRGRAAAQHRPQSAPAAAASATGRGRQPSRASKTAAPDPMFFLKVVGSRLLPGPTSWRPGTELIIGVRAKETIADVKARIEERRNLFRMQPPIPPQHMSLMLLDIGRKKILELPGFLGRVLPDTITLREAGLDAGCAVRARGKVDPTGAVARLVVIDMLALNAATTKRFEKSVEDETPCCRQVM